MMQDVQKRWAKFESLGEDEVRRRLMAGAYNGDHKMLAESWLRGAEKRPKPDIVTTITNPVGISPLTVMTSALSYEVMDEILVPEVIHTLPVGLSVSIQRAVILSIIALAISVAALIVAVIKF